MRNTYHCPLRPHCLEALTPAFQFQPTGGAPQEVLVPRDRLGIQRPVSALCPLEPHSQLTPSLPGPSLPGLGESLSSAFCPLLGSCATGKYPANTRFHHRCTPVALQGAEPNPCYQARRPFLTGCVSHRTGRKAVPSPAPALCAPDSQNGCLSASPVLEPRPGSPPPVAQAAVLAQSRAVPPPLA